MLVLFYLSKALRLTLAPVDLHGCVPHHAGAEAFRMVYCHTLAKEFVGVQSIRRNVHALIVDRFVVRKTHEQSPENLHPRILFK